MKTFWIVLACLIILIGGFFAWNSYKGIDKQFANNSEEQTESNQEEKTIVENFSINERLSFSASGISFKVPQETKSIVRTIYPSRNGLQHEVLKISYEGGTITVVANNYNAEWTAGSPVATISTSSITIGAKTYTSMLADTYKWTKELGYNDFKDLEGKEFGVLLINNELPKDNNRGTMITFDAHDDTQRAVGQAFIQSLEFIP